MRKYLRPELKIEDYMQNVINVRTTFKWNLNPGKNYLNAYTQKLEEKLEIKDKLL